MLTIPQLRLATVISNGAVADAVFRPRDGFNDPLNIRVRRVDGTYTLEADPFDLIDFTLNGGDAVNEYWVDYTLGNDANPGTEAQPWKTISHYRTNAVSPAICYINNAVTGILGAGVSFAGAGTITGNHKFVNNSGGVAYWCGIREDVTPVWSATGTYSYRSNTVNFAGTRTIADKSQLDDWGMPYLYQYMASEVEVDATPGSHYFNSVDGYTYIRTIDGRAPDADIIWNASAYRVSVEQTEDDGVLLWEGFTFVFAAGNTVAPVRVRNSNFTTPNNSRVGFKNCKSIGAAANGFEFYDARIIAMSGCDSQQHLVDCFNYHSFIGHGSGGGNWMSIYEYNCRGRKSGYTGGYEKGVGDSANITTMHDGMSGIRVNGLYYDAHGAVVADVNGSSIEMFGCAFGISNSGANPQACIWNGYTAGDPIYSADTVGATLTGCSSFRYSDDEIIFSTLNSGRTAAGLAQIRLREWSGSLLPADIGTARIADYNGNNI